MHEIVLLIIAAPLIGSLALPLLGRVSEAVRNLTALILVLTSLICTVFMGMAAAAGETALIVLPLPLGFNLTLYADMLAVFMAFVSTSIGAVIVFYSFDYIKEYPNRNEYYFLVTLFIGSMMGIVFSANLIFLYVFWELTAIASWRLIGFFREKTVILRADKSFLVTVFGALAMLIGFIMIAAQAYSFDLPAIHFALRGGQASSIAVALILAGIFSKSATLPFHTWLPDAGVAPSPVTALLHAAVLVKIGVYVYVRLFFSTIPIEAFWHTAVPVIAGASALISAGAAVLETDLKRLIAYSTISQIGFIFLGLSVGSEAGLAGGLIYILMHGIAKGGLFLCAGIIEHATHTKDITRMGGLLRSMPWTGISFLLCAFSVMGIPPFGGFFSKYLVIAGAASAGQAVTAGVFILGAVLTLVYLIRAFYLVFLGEEKIPGSEHSVIMVSSVSALAALSLISGIAVQTIAVPVRVMVLQLSGMVR